jgi:hypothetical protein
MSTNMARNLANEILEKFAYAIEEQQDEYRQQSTFSLRLLITPRTYNQ